MENENRYGTGEGQGPDYHTGNREPVIVAEQPAREVTEEDSEQALPDRMVPMDGAVLWTHPYRRTGGTKPGINPIWEVPGNQPHPGHRMTQERKMASAEMTASRYISQLRLLMVRASRGQIRVSPE